MAASFDLHQVDPALVYEHAYLRDLETMTNTGFAMRYGTEIRFILQNTPESDQDPVTEPARDIAVRNNDHEQDRGAVSPTSNAANPLEESTNVSISMNNTPIVTGVTPLESAEMVLSRDIEAARIYPELLVRENKIYSSKQIQIFLPDPSQAHLGRPVEANINIPNRSNRLKEFCRGEKGQNNLNIEVSKSWQKNQPNDHTKPSIKDDSTADTSIHQRLIPPAERPEKFKGLTVEQSLKPLPEYSPIEVIPRRGRPRNLDLNKKYTPLDFFFLLFSKVILLQIVEATNSYASRNQKPTGFSKFLWTPLSLPELLQFFGCLLKIALSNHPTSESLYRPGGALSGAPISKQRFHQIIQYIHLVDRGSSPEKDFWWAKIEPVLSKIRSNCQYYWEAGSELTVDELMLSFLGRTLYSFIIPSKPIPKGFKIFALAERGYIFNWEYCAPGWNSGAPKKEKTDVSLPDSIGIKKTQLNPTQSVVARLASILPQGVGLFHLYLDNLFVCWRLCHYFKQLGIAVTGTVRKGAVGYPPRLSALKKENQALKLNVLQATVIHGVLCWLWQDMNAVMGMTTGFSPFDFTERIRRRPKMSSTHGVIAKEEFGNKSTKNIQIPTFIDRYNMGMGGVDLANQYRNKFSTHFNRTQKEFFPGLFWALDLVFVNIYILYIYTYGYPTTGTGKKKTNDHRQFLTTLMNQLLQFESEKNFFDTEKTAKTQYQWVPRPRGGYQPKKIIIDPDLLFQDQNSLKIQQFDRNPLQEIPQASNLPPILHAKRGRPQNAPEINLNFRYKDHYQILSTTQGRCVICRTLEKKETVTNQRYEQGANQKLREIPIQSLGVFQINTLENQKVFEKIKREGFYARQTRYMCDKCHQPICKQDNHWEKHHEAIIPSKKVKR